MRSGAAFAARFFAIIVIFLSASGCGGIAPFAGEKGVVRTPYGDMLKAWTDGVKVYNGLDATIYVTATFKSPQFREAYIIRYTEGIKADDALKKMLMEKEAEEYDKYNEVFMSVFTPEDDWNDLEKANSVWRLYLEDGRGARLTPVSIKKVEREDILVREFFPYFDVWSSAYVVRFPKYSDAGVEPIPGKETMFLRLIVTGVLGEGSVEWRMK